MPRNGRVAAVSSTTSRSPDASRQAMQSGIALWPGSTTRAAPRISPGSLDTTIERVGATCTSAFATERRLPMP